MKKTALVVQLALVILILAGCEDANKKKQMEKDYTDMVTETALLRKDIDARDKFIDQIMKSVNEIYVSLERTRTKTAKVLAHANVGEGEPKISPEDIRKLVLKELYVVSTQLRANSKRISSLQDKLNTSAQRYGSLEMLVGNLKSSVAEREKAIASLEDQVKSLRGDIAEKVRELGEKDELLQSRESMIQNQVSRMNTVYYVAGTRDELVHRGIISKEGGFLWGLLGATTVMSADADSSDFRPIDMTQYPAIHVNGKVAELIPRRTPSSFQVGQAGSDDGYVMIKKPKSFWRDKYLVIVLD